MPLPKHPDAAIEMDQKVKQRPQPPVERHKCPRCHSENTKFCYYNNYSLSQPRYFCKACKRYWTKGGALRNIPFGGSGGKSKRGRNSASLMSSYATSGYGTDHDQFTPPPAPPQTSLVTTLNQLQHQIFFSNNGASGAAASTTTGGIGSIFHQGMYGSEYCSLTIPSIQPFTNHGIIPGGGQQMVDLQHSLPSFQSTGVEGISPSPYSLMMSANSNDFMMPAAIIGASSSTPFFHQHECQQRNVSPVYAATMNTCTVAGEGGKIQRNNKQALWQQHPN